MSKLWIVARREYRETVRKKAFLIVTILMPLLFGGMMFIPMGLMRRMGGEKPVLVLDGTGQLAALMEPAAVEPTPTPERSSRRTRDQMRGKLRFEVRPTDDVESAVKLETDPWSLGEKNRWSAVVGVPAAALEGAQPASYYSGSATDLINREMVHSALHHAVMQLRVRHSGLDSEQADRLLRRVGMEFNQVTRSGTSQRGGEMDLLLVLVFALMLLLPTIFQSQEILRGIIQEKTDRVVESLVSSMPAFDLLTGKVLGLAAVGLTQIAVWSVMGGLLSTTGAATMAAMGFNVLDLVTPIKLVWFVVFFLVGYLINACMFAAGGAMVNSEKEAQQVLQPVMLVLMIPWMVIMIIVSDPDGTMATVMSMLPFLGHVPMFVRILVGAPPLWQIAVSLLGAALSIVFLFWLAARIFRVGILWYGKRPSLPEFIRWARMP